MIGFRFDLTKIPQDKLEDKVKAALNRYVDKFNKLPKLIRLHPREFDPELKIENVIIESSEEVGKGCIDVIDPTDGLKIVKGEVQIPYELYWKFSEKRKNEDISNGFRKPNDLSEDEVREIRRLFKEGRNKKDKAGNIIKKISKAFSIRTSTADAVARYYVRKEVQDN